MTRINKLTQNPELFADDLFVIWDNDNQRTRSITAETLNKYTDANGANAQAFVNGYIQDGILYMVRANDEVVNIGSVTGVELVSEGSIPKAENGKLVDSPMKVDEFGNVTMTGSFTAGDLITNISSLNLGDQKKISGLGEGVEIHDLSRDRHKFIVTQWLDKDEDTRAFHYIQTPYALINIQPEFDTTLKDPQFNFTTQLGDQVLYGFEVKVNETQNNCVAQIFRHQDILDGGDDVSPIWEEEFSGVESDTLVLSSPVVLDGQTDYAFKITGEFLGNAEGKMYYSIGSRLATKQNLVGTESGLNVESIVAGNKIAVDDSDPKNPIVSWDPSGDLLPGVNINKDGVQVLSAADTLNFDSAFNVTKAKDTGGTVNIELSNAARGTNEVGVFESTTDLLAAYPTPEDGLYARVLQGNNNLPDDRYESKGGSWIGMGGVAGQVIVDANKSLGLIMGDGLKSEDDGGNSKISLDGNTPVLTFDVTADSTRSVDTSYVGKLINIIQTPPSISIPMQMTLVDHSQFKTGDTIKIAADRDGDNAYKNYYFAVYFNDSKGRQIARYPANNITMVRTDTAWDVQLDGRFTNVSIRPKAAFNIPYAPDEQYNTPVNAFVFAESPAVEFEVDEDTNTRIVKVELDKAIPEDPTFKTVNIDTFGSGQPNFTAAIKQDGELHTIVEATREFRVNHKDIGTGALNTVFGVDNNQAQFLVPIYVGADKVALEKDVPAIPDDGYIEKYTRADTDYVQVAYQGKYDDDKVYYPVSFSQDSNGWTQLKFTGNMIFHCNNKDTGSELSKPFEIRQSKVVHNVQPYYGDNKLAIKASNNISNAASFNDVITTGGKSVSQWISENPSYTPSQLLDVVFDSKVLGESNWVVSLTASNNTYNGTIPSGYSQWELHKTGGAARNFMRVYHKESHSVYFSPYKEGEDPVWKKYAWQEDVSTEIDDKIAADKAKGIWIGGVFKDTLNDDGHSGDQFDCGDPKHFIEFRKTSFQGDYFLVRQRTAVKSSDITIHLHPESGMASCPFRVVTSDGKYRNRTIRVNEKWRFWLREGTYPWAERIDDGEAGYILEDEFNAKSGYSALVSGGGSTKTVTYGDNGKILKISNPTVKVELLQGMNAEDKPHGYFKYINSHNADVAFEWYDRNGTRITSNVPSVCPKDTVVEVFADYAKDEYVLNFSQSKVISSVSEEKVQQIVSKSFDSLLQPDEGTGPFSKHPLPNPQGYLSTYSSVMYDDEDRLVAPRNAYDRTLFELFFEASKSTAYCTISIATVELMLGRILHPEDIELGIALEQSTAITPGLYSATTPSNIPSTWAWNGKFIPLTTEAGEHNDPNNPSVWLSQDGDYVYSESEAGNKPKYDSMNIGNLMVKDGQTWRYALRRGYIMKDGSFVFDAESPYYAFVIKISGYQTPQSKIHTVFFNRGGISLYPDAISAYMSANKLADGLGTIINEMVTDGDLSDVQIPKAQSFINESTVNVDYPTSASGNQYRPQNVVVTVLDTDNLISELNINVISSDGYSGHYNSVGSISIDASGQWSTESRRNAYRLDDGTNTYCVFSGSLNAWVLIVTDVDHNHTGSSTGGVPVNLYNDGQLPESHGDYSIENNLDSIDSEYFTQADVDIDYHTNSDGNSYFVVKFGSAKPAGIVFYK